MSDNSALLELQEHIRKQNCTSDGREVLRYSMLYYNRQHITDSRIIDDVGLFVLYDEYRWVYDNGNEYYEELSSMEIYKDDIGDMHIIDPDAFTPHCQYDTWVIAGSLPSKGIAGSIYVVKNSSYETKEAMMEALASRANCNHRYYNGMLSIYNGYYGVQHCAQCGKSWDWKAFNKYLDEHCPSAIKGVRYVKYNITVKHDGNKDYVIAKVGSEFSFGYDGPKQHLFTSHNHYYTADNIIFAARAFYELGYFNHEDSACIYVMYGEDDDFIRSVSAEYPATRIGIFFYNLFKRTPKIVYARSMMEKFCAYQHITYEVLNNYAYKLDPIRKYSKGCKSGTITADDILLLTGRAHG